MKINILSIIFFALCLFSSLFVNYYPVGDWVSAPLINLLIFFPALIVELILMIYIFASNKFLKIILYLQCIIALICLSLMIQYILVH